MAAILCFSAADTAFAKDCVVLLHGMGRTHFSMLRLQSSLEGGGYEVWNRSYPSTQKTIEPLAQRTVHDKPDPSRANPTQP